MTIMETTQILREMSLVRQQVKDKELQAKLLQPLEAKLRAIAEEQARQMTLPGLDADNKANTKGKP